jgi:hypothetical protein
MEKVSIEGGEVSKNESHPVKEKIKKIGELIAMVALLNLFSVREGVAQENPEIIKKLKGEIEQIKIKTADEEKKLEDFVIQKGGEGNINGIPIREFISPLGERVITMGGSLDSREKPWIIVENKNASVRYFDENSDGLFDRIIFNDDDKDYETNGMITPAGLEAKSFDNINDTFEPFEEVAKRAEDHGAGRFKDLPMLGKIKKIVIDVSEKSGAFFVQGAYYETGEVIHRHGVETVAALANFEKLQNCYLENLEKILGECK